MAAHLQKFSAVFFGEIYFSASSSLFRKFFWITEIQLSNSNGNWNSAKFENELNLWWVLQTFKELKRNYEL